MINKKKLALEFILTVIFTVIATASIIQGFSNAQFGSQDFQWSPSLLFWSGYNPYTYYLNGNQKNLIILSQFPNYSHLTYLLLFPFTKLEWYSAKQYYSILNIIFGVISVLIIGKVAKLRPLLFYWTILIFLSSTPFRNNIGNGQHSIFVLFFFCTIFLIRPFNVALYGGFGYFKYSFLPAFASFIFFRYGLRYLLLSLLPCALGWLFFSLYLHENFVDNLFLPLRVATSVVGVGAGDIMTITSIFIEDRSSYLSILGGYFIPLIINIWAGYYAAKLQKSELLLAFSLISITSIFTFKHLSYDYIFLLPIFIYSIKNLYHFKYKILLFLILVNWFGLKIISYYNIDNIIIICYNFLSFSFIFLVLMNEVRSILKSTSLSR